MSLTDRLRAEELRNLDLYREAAARIEELEAEVERLRQMDMFRAGVEAAAKAAEEFFAQSEEPADISASQAGQMISTHAIRPLITQPMPGATVGGELRALRDSLAAARAKAPTQETPE